MEKKAKKKKRNRIILIIVAVIVVVAIIGLKSCSNIAKNTTVVTTTQATRGEIQDSISTSGLGESEQQKTYFAKVSGPVASVNVSAGEWV